MIADDLRQRIARERLKPGDRLPNERSLTEHYGCAKGTIREALTALEVAGLVKMQTGRRFDAAVADLSSFHGPVLPARLRRSSQC
jgi:DNA-binding FadR family transcriptional regulator